MGVEIVSKGKSKPASKNKGGIEVVDSNTRKREIVDIYTNRGSNVADAVNNADVVTPVSHTIKIGDGPAVPVASGPTFITPPDGVMPITSKGKK